MCMVLLMQGKSAADIGKWMREHAGDAAYAPEFAQFLAMQLFDHVLGPFSVSPSTPALHQSARSAGMAAAQVRYHVVTFLCRPEWCRLGITSGVGFGAETAEYKADMMLLVQNPSKPVFNADSEFVPLLLAFVADDHTQKEALVWGAQYVYKDRKSRKG